MSTTNDIDYAEGKPVRDEKHGVLLSKAAQAKARSLLESEGREDLRLRVQVSPGGCSGLIYGLYFDDRVLDGDAITDHDGLELIIDKMSAPYLAGASVDFEDSISRQGFQINNPNMYPHFLCIARW